VLRTIAAIGDIHAEDETLERVLDHLAGLSLINAGTISRENDPCFALIDVEAGRAQFFDLAKGAIVPAAVHSIGRQT